MEVRKDIAAGDGELEVATIADVCADPEIVRYQKLHPTLNALVRKDGVVFAGEPGRSGRRQLRALARLAQERLDGDAAGTVQHVSPTAVERWRSRNRAKSSEERAVAEGETNRLVTHVFDAAVRALASDVYIDINVKDDVTRIGHRVYGRKLHAESFGAQEGLELCRSLWAQSQSGQFDESAPCDCSFEHVAPLPGESKRTKLYRVRANSVRDVVGNSVVCRLRDPSFVLPLEKTGYSDLQMEHIRAMSASPGGLLLITGETNSGKSTTAASLLESLPKTQKIIAIEDPVEVVFEHVTHIEINRYHEQAEQVFRKVLAATVRQNPDTLFLGEIRDLMSAEAGMDMAIQGKRVISTVHTQSCTAAIPRLALLGVQEDLLALREFIAGIVNQNLVPIVCAKCGLDAHPNRRADERYRRLFGDGCRHINPEGCESCAGGVQGQTLVAEVYPLCLDRGGKAHKLIAEKDFVGLEKHMRSQWGVVTKHDHAREKVAAGLVDPQECEAIIGAFVDGNTGKAAPLVQHVAAAG